MILIDSENIKCPRCGNKLHADVYETEGDTDIPTDSGFHLFCNDDPFAEDYCKWMYDELIYLNQESYKWMCNNVRKIPIG